MTNVHNGHGPDAPVDPVAALVERFQEHYRDWFRRLAGVSYDTPELAKAAVSKAESVGLRARVSPFGATYVHVFFVPHETEVVARWAVETSGSPNLEYIDPMEFRRHHDWLEDKGTYVPPEGFRARLEDIEALRIELGRHDVDFEYHYSQDDRLVVRVGKVTMTTDLSELDEPDQEQLDQLEGFLKLTRRLLMLLE
jgi:hypothetical protein